VGDMILNLMLTSMLLQERGAERLGEWSVRMNHMRSNEYLRHVAVHTFGMEHLVLVVSVGTLATPSVYVAVGNCVHVYVWTPAPPSERGRLCLCVCMCMCVCIHCPRDRERHDGFKDRRRGRTVPCCHGTLRHTAPHPQPHPTHIHTHAPCRPHTTASCTLTLACVRVALSLSLWVWC
jgi:hypothetical protein